MMAGIEDIIRVYRGTENIPADGFKPLRYPDAGKYFTTDIDTAKNYATRANTLSGKVNYLDLTKEEFEKAKNLSKSRSIRLPGEVIVDDDLLKKQKTDILRTIMARAKNLTPLAVRGLNMLASLPVATITAVLQSTPVNADEVNMTLEDFAKLNEGDTNIDKSLLVEAGDM
jgi:hypothetical protein